MHDYQGQGESLCFFSQRRGGPRPFLIMMDNRTLSCTLLVPPDLFGQVVGDYRVANTLRFLLLRHEWKARGRREGHRITTRYQQSAARLRKVAFRVGPDLWFQLGCYARVLGVSRCLAFVLLMEAELANTHVGTPPGKRWRKNWRRHYLLYYEIVGLRIGARTIRRRRKYVDNATEARMKRIFLQFEGES